MLNNQLRLTSLARGTEFKLRAVWCIIRGWVPRANTAWSHKIPEHHSLNSPETWNSSSDFPSPASSHLLSNLGESSPQRYLEFLSVTFPLAQATKPYHSLIDCRIKTFPFIFKQRDHISTLSNYQSLPMNSQEGKSVILEGTKVDVGKTGSVISWCIILDKWICFLVSVLESVKYGQSYSPDRIIIRLEINKDYEISST